MENLQARIHDLNVRYGLQAKAFFFDAVAYQEHKQFYEQLLPKPDIVAVAFGYLGDQRKGQTDFTEARRIIETNLLGTISIIETVASDFEDRGQGTIIGISSVAGERGRQSNYLYGAAKGAVTVYLSGLRNRLSRKGVKVITILPGFIRSKMTEHMVLPEILTADPQEVAEQIHRAWVNGKDIVYVKWYWNWIMMLVRLLPEKVFKQINF
jgi:short-subunit dehydrogenase